jgi:hypothetical protein
MTPSFPARLHVLLARDAPLGVLIRRGPPNAVCTLLWNRLADTFLLGQWLRGRLYERRSDLSPDGRHLIYFAMNGRWHEESKGSWTAISRAPYLKAVVFYPKGDCWQGGGLFTANNQYWLHGCHCPPTPNTRRLRRDDKFNHPGIGNAECLGVYYPRLLRDGWTYAGQTGARYNTQDVFEKPAPGGWTLRKIAHSQIDSPEGKGCYWDEHELLHPERNVWLGYPDWEWAEVDRDRLVWAEKGRLLAGRLDDAGPTEVVELRNFNGITFEPLTAPY